MALSPKLLVVIEISHVVVAGAAHLFLHAELGMEV
jgi:hypothetical protein